MESNTDKTMKKWKRIVIGVLALAAFALVVIQLKDKKFGVCRKHADDVSVSSRGRCRSGEGGEDRQ